MKAAIFAMLFIAIAPFLQAFVLPLSFDQKCRDAEAILEITVEKVEKIKLTEGMVGQFQALARCKVESTFKGDPDRIRKFIFMPCDYPVDESPCEIEAGKRYVVFIEALGKFSNFADPLSAFCCHPVKGGEVNPEYFGDEWVELTIFAEKVRASLKASTPSPDQRSGPKGGADQSATVPE